MFCSGLNIWKSWSIQLFTTSTQKKHTKKYFLFFPTPNLFWSVNKHEKNYGRQLSNIEDEKTSLNHVLWNKFHFSPFTFMMWKKSNLTPAQTSMLDITISRGGWEKQFEKLEMFHGGKLFLNRLWDATSKSWLWFSFSWGMTEVSLEHSYLVASQL